MMSEVQIKIAAASDLKVINEFLSKYFHDKEPVEMSHIDKTDKMIPDNEFLLDCIESQTSLMAFSEGDLVGILLSGEILPNEAERNLECSKQIKSKKSADILKFLSYIEQKADYCNRLEVPNCLHIHIVSVHPKHQGLGIAKSLFKFCIERGKCMNYPGVSIDCTNFRTAKIAESVGLSCLSTVTYDEYNEHIGDKIFIAGESDKIQCFAKLYGKHFE